jgi:RecA/RadA recombinase
VEQIVRVKNLSMLSLKRRTKMRLSVTEAVERLSRATKFSTGSRCVDLLLEGGVAQFSVYHFFGASGTGKTQLSMQTSAIAASTGELVAYIDTEGKFRPERVVEMAETRGIDVSFLRRIQYFRADNLQTQLEAMEKIRSEEKFKYVRVVIVDTFTNNLTLQLPGKENMFRRQSYLSFLLERVCKDAYISGRAYILTNRVALSEPEVHVGGKVMEYMVGRNIKLERSGGSIFVIDVEKGRKCKTELTVRGLE